MTIQKFDELLDAEKSSEASQLYDRTIENLRQYLESHEMQNHHGESGFNRFSKIILKVMALRTLDQEVVEELLFNNLLQQIKINSIIPYIVSLGGTNGNDVSPGLTDFNLIQKNVFFTVRQWLIASWFPEALKFKNKNVHHDDV